MLTIALGASSYLFHKISEPRSKVHISILKLLTLLSRYKANCNILATIMQEILCYLTLTKADVRLPACISSERDEVP